MALHAANLLNAFLLAVVLVIALAKLAEPAGLVDRPSARKTHEGRVPVIGGIAMFGAFATAMLMLGWPPQAPWELLCGLLILTAIGMIDDIHDLRAEYRLLAHTMAASVMIVPGWHVITDLATLPGGPSLTLGMLGLPFTLIFIVGTINAYNMLDGLDGLAGGTAATAFLWLAVASGLAGNGHHVVVLLLLSATLGFLIFNAPLPWRGRALVFMGDAGSTMLGAGVSFFIAVLASAPDPIASLPALLWICALPAIDTLSLIVRRLHAGRSPFAADRRHLHHLLLQSGLSPRRVTCAMVAASFALGGVGIAGALIGVPDPVMLAGLALPVAAHTWIVRRVQAQQGATASAELMMADTRAPVGGSGR